MNIPKIVLFTLCCINIISLKGCCGSLDAVAVSESEDIFERLAIDLNPVDLNRRVPEGYLYIVAQIARDLIEKEDPSSVIKSSGIDVLEHMTSYNISRLAEVVALHQQPRLKIYVCEYGNCIAHPECSYLPLISGREWRAVPGCEHRAMIVNYNYHKHLPFGDITKKSCLGCGEPILNSCHATELQDTHYVNIELEERQ